MESLKKKSNELQKKTGEEQKRNKKCVQQIENWEQDSRIKPKHINNQIKCKWLKEKRPETTLRNFLIHILGGVLVYVANSPATVCLLPFMGISRTTNISIFRDLNLEYLRQV